jgi:hypothetical protein
MARNEEKAMTLFSKWTTFKTDYHSGKSSDTSHFLPTSSDKIIATRIVYKLKYLQV